MTGPCAHQLGHEPALCPAVYQSLCLTLVLGLIPINSNPHLRGYEDEMKTFLCDCMTINDWLQCYDHKTRLTPYGFRIKPKGWNRAIRTACGQTCELWPGALGLLIDEWKPSVTGMLTADLIARAFIELRERPIQKLERLPKHIFRTWQADFYGYEIPPPIGKDVVLLPIVLFARIKSLGLPRVFNSFHVVVGTDTQRRKDLIRMSLRGEDHNGLIFADLIGELGIWWL